MEDYRPLGVCPIRGVKCGRECQWFDYELITNCTNKCMLISCLNDIAECMQQFKDEGLETRTGADR